MATLWISPNADTRVGTPRAIREWLAGDWCLLFSHPQDFDASGLECDRWLALLRDDFLKRRVRPLAYGNRGECDRSWVSQLIGDEGAVGLSALRSTLFDLASRTLRDDILAQQGRFVMIFDDHLRRRGLLTYSPARNRVSPFDLLASVDAMRRGGDLRHAA
jgi:hypothetical protein